MKHIWIVVLGFALVALGQLASQVMRLTMRQAARETSGTYTASDYTLDLTSYRALCGVILVIGMVASIREGTHSKPMRTDATSGHR